MNHDPSEQNVSKSGARWFVTILLVFVLLLGAGGIVFVWLTIQPKYLVSGLIHIAPTASSPWDSDPKPYDRDAYAAFMRTQAAMLTSASVLSHVAEELAAQKLAFFSPAGMPAPEKGTLPAPSSILKQAVADGVIKAAPIPDTELLEVTMVSEKPDDAKIIVNSLRTDYQNLWGANEAQAANQNLTMLEDEEKALSAKISQQRAEIRAVTEPYGTSQLDSRVQMESQRQQALWSELTRLELRQMSLEAAAESSVDGNAAEADPVDLLSRRQDYVDSDPLAQALAARIADVQVNLAFAREKEPNDTATLQRQGKILDNLNRQFDQLRQSRQQQFEQELSDAGKKQSQQRRAQMELQQVRAYQERLRKELQAESLPVVGKASVDVQEVQFELKLNDELYEKVLRRIHEIQWARTQGPRVRLVSEPEVRDLVDGRWSWTLLVAGFSVIPGVVLLIVRRAIRPR